MNISFKQIPPINILIFPIEMAQFLCARGYSDKVAGVVASSFLLVGCLGAFPIGMIVHKVQKQILVSKICIIFAGILEGANAYAVTLPSQLALLITLNSALGAIILG